MTSWRAEQVSFLGLTQKGGSIQGGRRRVGRLDHRGHRILSNQCSSNSIAARLDGRDHGLARSTGPASGKILSHLDSVPYRRPTSFVLRMVIGRDGKRFDPVRTARGECDDCPQWNFLKSSRVYWGMIIFASNRPCQM